jgi:hypothetical protein
MPAGTEWSPPTSIAPPNDSTGYELGVAVTPDERYMIVTVIGLPDALTNAEAIYPRADLYLRERADGGWSRLRHLPSPVNSPAEEGSAAFSPDGKQLLFTSERGSFTEHGDHARTTAQFESALHAPGNGLGDLYLADLALLGLKP